MAKSTEKNGFSRQEREAMKARANELAAEKGVPRKRAEGELSLREAIEEMAEPDQVLAQRIHEIVTKTVPDLWPKTWYGMPAYALEQKVICFFQAASKFDSR